jgi:hypothetical protein
VPYQDKKKTTDTNVEGSSAETTFLQLHAHESDRNNKIVTKIFGCGQPYPSE